jgi:hypothetical protein
MKSLPCKPNARPLVSFTLFVSVMRNSLMLSGIKDGGMAMEAFCEALQPTTSAARKEEIERQLLAYCRLDTFAMVRLWQFFRSDKIMLIDTP